MQCGGAAPKDVRAGKLVLSLTGCITGKNGHGTSFGQHSIAGPGGMGVEELALRV